MLIPGSIDPESFFLTVNSETGEIYCAHQEYVALEGEGQGELLVSQVREDAVLAIAVKANPAARSAENQLRMVRVICDPSTNFSRYRVDIRRNELVEREPRTAADTDVRINFEGGAS